MKTALYIDHVRNDTIVVDDDDLLIRHLCLSIFKDSIVINIPRIVEVMIVQDAFLIPHDHVLVKVIQIHDT